MSCGYEQRWNQKSFLQLTSKTKATNQTNSYKENNVHNDQKIPLGFAFKL